MRRRRYSDPGERGQGPKPARRQRGEREAARRDRGRMKRKQEGRSRSRDGRPRGAEGGARSCRQSLRCCRARCCRCRFCFTCKMWVRTSPGALPAWPLPGEALVCRRNPAGIVCLSQPRAATAWSALESPRRWSSRGSRRRRLLSPLVHRPHELRGVRSPRLHPSSQLSQSERQRPLEARRSLTRLRLGTSHTRCLRGHLVFWHSPEASLWWPLPCR